jgi:hypothetical protein
MGVTSASALWRRLDSPGHDACRLDQDGDGWQLEGSAVFLQDAVPVLLAYRLTCDASWVTREGLIRGWIGPRPVDYYVVRTAAGEWTLNDERAPGLAGCLDLDLGFTPATNLQQMRRVALAEGESADVPVAWLDVFAGALTLLSQRYERRGRTTYWYESPSAGYSGLLEVARNGFVRRYPGLWEMEGV